MTEQLPPRPPDRPAAIEMRLEIVTDNTRRHYKFTPQDPEFRLYPAEALKFEAADTRALRDGQIVQVELAYDPEEWYRCQLAESARGVIRTTFRAIGGPNAGERTVVMDIETFNEQWPPPPRLAAKGGYYVMSYCLGPTADRGTAFIEYRWKER